MTDCCIVVDVELPGTPSLDVDVEIGPPGVPGAIAQDAPNDGKQYTRVNSTWEENDASKTKLTPSGGVTANNTQQAVYDIDTRVSNIESGETITKGSLTKTFTAGETVTINLSSPVSPAPVLGVTIEQPSTGLSNDKWDIVADDTRFDQKDFAIPGADITPSGTTGSIILTLSTGSFTSDNVGMSIIGNGGAATLDDVTGNATVITPFNDTSTISSGNWVMYGLRFDEDGVKITNTKTAPVYNRDNSIPVNILENLAAIVGDGSHIWLFDNTQHVAYRVNENTGLYDDYLLPIPDIPPMVGAAYYNSEYWLITNTGNVSQYDQNLVPTGSSFSTGLNDVDDFTTVDGAFFYVVRFNDGNVYRYNTSGALLDTYNISTQVSDPRGIYWDGSYMWVLDNTTDNVYRYTDVFVYTGTNFSVGAQVNTTRGITKNSAGEFWVSSSTKSIYKYTTAGVYTGTNSDISQPVIDTAMTDITNDGTNLYLCGDQNNKVYKLDLTGTVISDFTIAETSVDGITFDGTNLWVIGSSSDTAIEYTTAGTATGNSFSVVGQMTTPESITFDGLSYWVLSSDQDAVFQYDNTGTPTGFSFSVAGQTGNPRGIYWDADKLSFIVVGTENDVFVYDISGNYTGVLLSLSESLGIRSKGVTKINDAYLFVGDLHGCIVEYASATSPVNSVYLPLITNDSGRISTLYWVDINDTVITDTENDGNIYYSFSNDNRNTWFVTQEGQGERNITRNNLGTWEYNNDSIYNSETWVAASSNDQFTALQEAMTIINNRMSGQNVNDLTDDYQPSLGDNLDIASIMYLTTGTNTPVFDTVVLNYDSQTINAGAINGTDYAWNAPANNAVSFTAINAGNYKIRVV